MERDFWQQQDRDKPLFPNILWSRPENKQLAGKLLVIGGNAHGFAAAAEAYQTALKAGAGQCKAVLPVPVRKVIGSLLPDTEFTAATPSGSFSKKVLPDWLAFAAWADAVLLAGDLGRNSETAILLEQFVQKYGHLLIVTKDAADYFTAQPKLLLERPNTTLVISLAQLQKMTTKLGFNPPIVFSMNLLQLVDALHVLTGFYPANVIVKHGAALFVACAGLVSTTKLDEDLDIWRVPTAARASVFWLQNPSQPFEALTTALVTNQ
jgi:hypothetical protein